MATAALGLALALPFMQGGGGQSLASLFANGEDGFLFGNFADLTRQFLLFTGGANVASDGDPEGLTLDNHSWGGKTLAEVLSAQPELIVNGSFATDLTGWETSASTAPSAVIWSAGRAVTQTDGVNAARMRQMLTVQVGKTYRVSAEGDISLALGTSGGGGQYAAFASPYSRPFVYVTATSTSLWISTADTSSGRTLDNVSVKEVSGNHALQATGTRRPFWKPNAGRPHLLFDGTDDASTLPYIPGAVGTWVAAFRGSGLNSVALGGGTVTGDKRLRVGLGAFGQPILKFNTVADISLSAVDRRDTDILMLVTWDAGGFEAYLDGSLAASGPTVANMDGTGSASAIGAQEGGLGSYLTGRVYAALARSRRSTPAEIALITSQFRSTYQ